MTSKIHITNYSPFGVLLQNRNFTSEGYRYGFQRQEKDDEVKGAGNHYGFADYGYAPRLGRRWQVDPKTRKYPDVSPYSFCFNSPIYVIDIDGLEGIVISGQPGNHNNKEHFLINGLDRAKAAKKHFQRKGEQVTWVIFNDGSKEHGHDPAMLKKYKAQAAKLGINVIEVSTTEEITSYVNSKTGGEARKEDPITSFYYIGHATPGEMRPGYQGSNDTDLVPADFKSDAFSGGCHINLVGGCRTAVGDWWGEESVKSEFEQIVDENSKIYSSDVKVEYGGGVVSDEQLVKPNNGKIVESKGNLPAKKKP
jgi:RHS repeat-associated protein